jgi:hypothetical protein
VFLKKKDDIRYPEGNLRILIDRGIVVKNINFK